MRKWLKNQKGLTLVELLAVIVILGVIAAIAVPAIGNVINNSKEKADIQTDNLIKDAAYRYVINEEKDATVTDESLSTLVNGGYLNQAPTWNDSGNNKTSFTATLDETSGNWTITLE